MILECVPMAGGANLPERSANDIRLFSRPMQACRGRPAAHSITTASACEARRAGIPALRDPSRRDQQPLDRCCPERT